MDDLHAAVAGPLGDAVHGPHSGRAQGGAQRGLQAQSGNARRRSERLEDGPAHGPLDLGAGDCGIREAERGNEQVGRADGVRGP